jgi:hypothetical protein
MTKLLAIAAATALMASAAYAQVETEPYWVQTDAEGAKIYNEENSEGFPLLEGENFAAPADCPEGSFFRSGENMVTACGEGGATFDLAEPEAGSMMPSGDPWPENAMVMTPQAPDSDSGSQKDTTGAASGAAQN